MNNVPKFRGCVILQTRVIWQRVSLKIIVFSMETPCWSLSEGLQHGGRKPVETSGAYFGSLKTFIPSVKLENSRIGTFSQHVGYSELENIRRMDIFVHVTCYPETMPMSRIEKKPCSIFKNKAVYRAEDKPAAVADPDIEGGGGLDFLAVLAFFPSVISSVFTQNKGGGGKGPSPRSATADICLKLTFT